MKFDKLPMIEKIKTIAIIAGIIILQIPIIYILNKMFGNKYYLYNAFMTAVLVVFFNISMLKNYRTIKEKVVRMLINFGILLIVYIPILAIIQSNKPNILHFVKSNNLQNSLYFFEFLGFVVCVLQTLVDFFNPKKEKY